MTATHKVLIICGPTASGKTSLALQLAKELSGANILSVDSRQVYKGLDIVTGKDIPHDLPSKISLFGINIFEPNERANLADFVRYSDQVLSDALSSKKPLIIVGGTGLYLKGIVEHPADIYIPPDNNLRQQLEKKTLQDLQKILQNLDMKKYLSLNRSDSMNPRRLIRHIEISSNASSSTETIINFPISYQWIGILPDKYTLKQKIRERVVTRLKLGAVEEVKKLIKEYPNNQLPIYTSLGVSQICAFLNGTIPSEDELVNIWTNAETDYARRQIVWFKKQPGIVWYDKSISQKDLVQKLKKIYQKDD